jgi:uncharacterized RmlC-like cupin family protein
MTQPLAPNAFSGVTDLNYLRAAIEVLGNLVDQINDQARIQGVGRDAEARSAGMHIIRQLTVRLRGKALDRMDDLRLSEPEREPVVLDPANGDSLFSVQGQPLTPLITAGAAHTSGLSSAQVEMPPFHRSFAHIHHHTDVGVFVHEGQAITVWWDRHGRSHELFQVAGQHLHIPAGVPHAAINPFSRRVVAAEFRPNPVFNADNHRLETLDDEVAERFMANTARRMAV